jgi:hypothetical protein
MATTFKCNKTGNTVTFKSEYDIESMRQHPEYTEVQEQQEVKTVAQRGRPRKDSFVVDSDTDSI